MQAKKIQQSSLASNGNPVFYYTKVLQDKSASAELYVTTDADGPRISLARAPLDSALYTVTQINWGTGTSFANYVAQGFGGVLNTISKARREAGNFWQQSKAILAALYNGTGPSGLNEIEGMEQYQILAGDSTHKKYQGSVSDISVPPLQFVFINEDDTDSYLRKCQTLLKYVLPEQTQLDQKNLNKQAADLNNEANKEGSGVDIPKTNRAERGKEVANSLSYRENPPGGNGGLKDPTVGYTLLNIENYFEIRLGYKKISYLVPTSVRVNISRSGSCSGADKKWRPHSVTVSISFDRIGKIFSEDISTNLLVNEGILSKNDNLRKPPKSSNDNNTDQASAAQKGLK